MKKVLQVLCILAMALAMTFGFAACGGTRSPETNDDQEQPTPTPGQPEDPEDPEEPDKLTFTGVTFESDTVVYDGKEHSLTVTGSLPQGTAVEYTNNVGTNAGVYSASATLSAENYETLTLTATLTIQKATFPADVALESDTVVYDGEAHSLTVTGSLPQGTTVEYTNNGKTEGGEYEVTATLTNPNYQTLILKGMLYIRTLADAKAIIDDILVRPDPWSFLPEALTPEKMAYTAMPVTDFTADTAVSAIGKRAVGKQLNVVYDILGHSQTALETADVIFTAGEAIAAAETEESAPAPAQATEEEELSPAKRKVAEVVSEYRYKNAAAVASFAASLVIGAFILAILAILPSYFAYVKLYDNPAAPSLNIFTLMWKVFAGGFVGVNAGVDSGFAWSIFRVISRADGAAYSAVWGAFVNPVCLLALAFAVLWIVRGIVRVMLAKEWGKAERRIVRETAIPLAGAFLCVVAALVAKDAYVFVLLVYFFAFALAASGVRTLTEAPGRFGKAMRVTAWVLFGLLAAMFVLYFVFSVGFPLPASLITRLFG